MTHQGSSRPACNQIALCPHGKKGLLTAAIRSSSPIARGAISANG